MFIAALLILVGLECLLNFSNYWKVLPNFQCHKLGGWGKPYFKILEHKLDSMLKSLCGQIEGI
jgi:hypothetical protein